MIRFVKYLFFQINATNLHGIHSPFLFKFLKEAVYKDFLPSSFKHSLNKEDQLFLSIIYYLKSEKIYLNDPSKEFQHLLNTYKELKPELEIYQGNNQDITNKSIDTFILNGLKSIDQEYEMINNISKSLRNIVIIPHIRASKQQLDFLRSISQKDQGSVILEFYHFALIINRKESTSEYFRIRK